MSKGIWTINKLNLKNIKVPYAVTGITFLTILVQDVIKSILSANGAANIRDEYQISAGNILWLLLPLAAIFIAAKNLRKIINLGGKRKSYFAGSIITYILLAGMVSTANTILYQTYDRFFESEVYGGYFNLLGIFGWYENGMILAFFQQFAFLLLVAAVTHTLTAMQDKWYGWATDIIIAAIISVFVPIAPLRAVLMSFFNLIIFQSSAFLQIITCLGLTALIYALSLPVINRKSI